MIRRQGVHATRRQEGVIVGGGNPLTIFQSAPPILWVRADLGVTNVAGACTLLKDQSRGGHNMAPSIAAGPIIQPGDSTLNGRQSLHFTNLLDLWTGAVLTLPTPFAYRLIAKPITWNSAASLVADGANANRGQISYAGASPNIYMDNGAFVNNTAVTLNTWMRFRANFTNSANDLLKCGSAVQVKGGLAGAGAPTNIAFNMNGGLGSAGVFDICELVVLPGIPSAAEDSAFDAYAKALTGGAVAF